MLKSATSFTSILIFSWSFFTFALADDSKDISNFLETSGHIRERVKILLDGSEAANGIVRASNIVNEVIFVGTNKWRVRRDLPFTEESFEFMRTDHAYKVMNPYNHGVEAPFQIKETTYQEVIASPIRWAKEFNLESLLGTDLDGLIARLKKAPAEAGGNKMEIETKEDGSITIKGSGKLVQDAKTKVSIEMTWEYFDQGKVTDTHLTQSLIRSL